MPSKNKKDLIIGLIKGYDFEVLRPFVETLKKTRYAGDVVFFCSGIDEITLDKLRKSGVKLIPFDLNFPYLKEIHNKWQGESRIQNLSIYCVRYLLAYSYLVENVNKYRNVMFSDVRDVIFQKNPFDFGISNQVCCFVEREGFAIKDSPVNAEWIEKGFGAEIYGKLADKPIICSGVTIGPVQSMIEYFKLFLDTIVSLNVPAELRGMDQGIHNYMIHEGLLPVRLYENNNGPVLTLGLEDEVKFEGGKVYNLKGQISNVVHQYDRHWRIAKHFYSWNFIFRCHLALWRARYRRVISIFKSKTANKKSMENNPGNKREKQVDRDVYEKGKYEHSGRWASYYYQIKNIMKSNPDNILEIGPGSGVTAWYLKSQGFGVTTTDIAEDLNPDVVADITNMPFEDGQFDTIACCEVLEHLPFEDSVKALGEIYRVTRNYAVISIPDHRRVLFSINIKLPFFQERYFSVRFPNFQKKTSVPVHYWEIGRPGYSLSRVRQVIRDVGFKIDNDFTISENPMVHFFILKK